MTTTQLDLGEFEGLPVVGMAGVFKFPGGPLNPALAIHAAGISKGDQVDIVLRTTAGAVKWRT